MHGIDWFILALPVIIVSVVGWRTHRHMKGVADFVVGGRAAGRYLLTTSELMAGMALISLLAGFEVNFNNGFVYMGPWQVLLIPLNLIVVLTGFLIYRYRETRVLTMSQLFEIRYSRRFRIFTGFLSAVAGILNYGLFPAVGGRFFVYFCGFPESFSLGGVNIPTFALVMFATLTIATILVFYGGQLSIITIDGVQAIFGYLISAIIIGYLFTQVSFSQIRDVLATQPPGESYVNPWDVSKLKDFNVWFWLIGVFGGIYGLMSSRISQSFNASAATPLEAKMGSILGVFRAGIIGILMTIIIVAAMVLFKHPDFADGGAAVQSQLIQIDNPAIRTQLTVPMALSHLLPKGFLGAFCALMLFLMISTDISMLHSWGSVVVQDCIMPLRKRKKPLSPERHIRLLRVSIICVALYAFFFSLLFKQTTYILFFFMITGAIYSAGVGAVIIFGLYWKRGTTAAAWTSMLSGAGIAMMGFVLDRIWQPYLYPWLDAHHPQVLVSFHAAIEWLNAHMSHLNLTFSPEKFPINTPWFWAFAMFTSIASYLIVSLLTCRTPFNLQRMLHRGQYAVDDSGQPMPKSTSPRFSLKSFVGIDSEMSKGDKRLTVSIFCYSMLLWVWGMTMLIWNVVPSWRWPKKWWSNWFLINDFGIGLGIALIAIVWFSWGTIRDLKRLFRQIDTQKQNIHDDGSVIGHISAADVVAKDRTEEKNDSNTVDN